MSGHFTVSLTKNRFPDVLRLGVRYVGDAVKKSVEAVAERARQLAPVDTGALRSSIRAVTLGGKNAVGTVEVGAEYGLYVELGTVHQSAQPYLAPAVAQVSESIGASVANAVQRGLAEATK